MLGLKKYYLCYIINILFVMLMSISFADTTVFDGAAAGDGTVEGSLLDMANILAGVAMLISAIKLMQIGYKFLLSGASKKSDAKAALIPWAVGVFICALWLSLGKWIVELLTEGGIAPETPFDLNF